MKLGEVVLQVSGTRVNRSDAGRSFFIGCYPTKTLMRMPMNGRAILAMIHFQWFDQNTLR